MCGCARNHIIWKWRCLPRVEKLGDVCVVSLQCPKGQDCHPLSKTCACPLYQPNCDQSFTITSTMASTAGMKNVKYRVTQRVLELQLNFLTLSVPLGGALLSLDSTTALASSGAKPRPREHFSLRWKKKIFGIFHFL